jgi:DNA mismatch repair protein MutL
VGDTGRSGSDLLPMSPAAPQEPKEFFPVNNGRTDISPYYQVHDTYIVAQTQQGFEIIDQHALHERIIYEQLYKRICSEDAGKLESQRLLIPETLEVRDSEAELLEEHRELLEQLGIIAESFGPSTYAIHAFPVLLDKVEPSRFLRDVIDVLSEMGIRPDREKLIHHILDMASCKAAIKAGKKLSIGEIEHLLKQRENTPRCGRCPHGRPTSILFSLKDLEKQFKRTGF